MTKQHPVLWLHHWWSEHTSALGTFSIRSKAMTKESYACAEVGTVGLHGDFMQMFRDKMVGSGWVRDISWRSECLLVASWRIFVSKMGDSIKPQPGFPMFSQMASGTGPISRAVIISSSALKG